MPAQLWDDDDFRACPDLEGLAYRAALLARDPTIFSIHSSVKLTQADHLERPTRVLYLMSGAAQTCPALRLDEITPLRQRTAMTDLEIRDYLSRTAFVPDCTRPPLEALLHAFLPYSHVDLTCSDAVLSLACTPDGQATARAVYGARIAWVNATRPDFTCCKQVSLRLADSPSVEGVIVGRYGLLTWGDSARQCYERTLQIIQEAEAYLMARRTDKTVFGPLTIHPPEAAARRELACQILPQLRGLLRNPQAAILSYDESEPVLDLLGRERAGVVAQAGAASPVHFRARPLYVPWSPERGSDALGSRLETLIAERSGAGDFAPPVILIPGLGLVTAGADAAGADRNRQHSRRTLAVMGASEALGGFTGADEADGAAQPLEAQPIPTGDLAGKVVFITGGASGIGRAAAHRLAAEGAHIAIADINLEGAQAVAADLVRGFGTGRGLALACDVTSEQQVAEAFRQTVLAYGGVDVVINNAGIAGSHPIEEITLAEWQRNIDILATGYFLVAREAFRLLRRQGLGGAMVFVCSKNSIAARKNAAAYGAAKAAELHLARCLAEEGGEHGIRVNSVLPDAVLQGSGIYSSAWREARARTYGIAPDELEAYYRQRNALKVNILPEDVAEAILFLAGPRSAKITGAVLTVDGGVALAYVR